SSTSPCTSSASNILSSHFLPPTVFLPVLPPPLPLPPPPLALVLLRTVFLPVLPPPLAPPPSLSPPTSTCKLIFIIKLALLVFMSSLCLVLTTL
ncbi:hypothetical protein GIB67_025790, partial [Kingdonia uniflora]